jgi:hypothetical protein
LPKEQHPGNIIQRLWHFWKRQVTICGVTQGEVYIYLVEDWIEQVENGRTPDECFPLLESWTSEHIEMLKTRISLLKNSILPGIAEISIDEIYFAGCTEKARTLGEN